MFIPEWMQQQHNAFLLVALLLTLWLWLLVNRRQEEEKIFVRKSPLSNEELGRAIFSACLSKDFMVYRSLFLNAKEWVSPTINIDLVSLTSYLCITVIRQLIKK